MTQFQPKINTDHPTTAPKQGKPRILVAPLDWGLGHATRCIPVIRELLKQGAEVWIAAEKAQAAILTEAFPDLPLLPLFGYQAEYAKTRSGLIWKMITQAPRLLHIIREERRWLKKIIRDYQIDAVISDNRYGLHHSSIPCVFITHQLWIETPFGERAGQLLQQFNYRYINRFSQCWVPDYAGEQNLAGRLSHPVKKPAIPLTYTGPLTRLDNLAIETDKEHLLILLSGPEPQRSILEEKMINELAMYNGTATLVRGLPGNAGLLPSTNQLHFYNHLPAAQLNAEIHKATRVICRSGYSSLMDMARLQKKLILIPTPGQTEQEYLGQLYQERKTALCISQDNFSLTAALQAASTFPYQPFPEEATVSLATGIQQLIASID